MGSLWQNKHYDNHEMIINLRNPYTGLTGIIAVHDSSCGRPAGGTRLWKYKTEEDMYADVCGLARAMTYKCAIHGLPHGGGKAVFNRDPKVGLTQSELTWYAQIIDRLSGMFSTGEDIGFTVDYVNHMSLFTKYVTGKSTELGGGGDPSLRTVEGLVHGMSACLAFSRLPYSTFEGYRFMVQGAGKVGLPLIENLLARSAIVYFCDTNEQHARSVQEKFPKATLVPTNEIFSYDFTFFAPCGKGGTVNKKTIPQLADTGCRFLVPSANNVLENPRANALMLQSYGILLAPDYAVNGGGMINIASEMLPQGYSAEWAKKKTKNIFDLILRIFEEAKRSGKTTIAVADRIARKHLLHMRRERKKAFLASA